MTQRLCKATQEECLCTVHNIGRVYQSQYREVHIQISPGYSHAIRLPAGSASLCRADEALFFRGTKTTIHVLKGVLYCTRLLYQEKNRIV